MLKRLICVTNLDGESILLEAKEVALYEQDQIGNYSKIETLYAADRRGVVNDTTP